MSPKDSLRASALRAYAILETPAEPAYEQLLQFVVGACDTPFAVLAFVDAERTRYKALAGLAQLDDGPAAHAFFAALVTQAGTVSIPDLGGDHRFGPNPWAAAATPIRFFACAPLVSPDGQTIGVLAAMDRVPREPTTAQRAALQGFAAQAMLLLEDRRRRQQRETATAEDIGTGDARFREFAETMPQIVWSATPDGYADYANRAMLDYIGPASDHGRGIVDWYRAIHPDEIEQSLLSWWQAVRSGGNFAVECRLRRADDGAYRWMLLRAEPVRDAQGAVRKWYGTATDIHDRKCAEQDAAREAETRAGLLAILQEIASSDRSLPAVLEMTAVRLMALFHPLGVQIDLLDGDELVRYGAAGATTRAVGLRSDGRRGMAGLVLREGKVLYCADTETDPRVDRGFARAMGVRSMVTAPLRANDAAVGLVRITSDHADGFAQLDIDRLTILSESLGGVIQHRRLAEDMRKSEEKYRVLFDDSPRPLLVYDPDSLRFLAANRSLAQLYGYTPEEFLGLTVLDLWAPGVDTVFPSREALAANVHSIPLHEEVRERRRQHRRRDGSHFEVEIASTRIVFEGKPVRLVHVQDLTERLKAEREIARLARAQRMLSACNEALIRATEEQQLLQRICTIAVDIGGYLLAWVGFAQDDADKTIAPAASAGEHASLVYNHRTSWSASTNMPESAAGRAIRSGRVDVVPDVKLDPLYPVWQSFAEAVGHKGLVCLPLRHTDATIGAMTLYTPETIEIGPSELKLLEELANDLAFGIHNLRALDEQRRLQAAVLKVGAAVSRQAGDEFYAHLVLSLVEAVGAQAGYVSQLLPGPPAFGRTLFATMDGVPIDSFDFGFEFTPCADYPTTDAWLQVDHATAHYPHSPFLARVQATSFAVRRLDNSAGEPIGLLAVLFRQPLEETGFIDSMLRIFAARAASELERQQSDVQLRDQASLLDKAQDAITVRDLQHRVIYWNQGCERLYGWRADEVLGRPIAELLDGNATEFAQLLELLLRDGEWSGEQTHQRKDGSTVLVEARCTLVRDNRNQPVSVLAINTDITRRKAAEEAVHKLAFFDALTGLPNRQLLNLTLQRARRMSAISGQCGSLLFVNLDNFKAVNETLGHVKGDILLKLASERIAALVAQADTVARIGGDEFLILLDPCHAQLDLALAHAADVAERILQAFAAPFALEDFEHLSTACIGIAAYSGAEVEDGELLKQVDLALYQAKSVGRGVIRFYDPRLQLAVAERAMLEAELRQALGNKELALYYQPQVHRDGSLLGVEALLRWKHPRRGMVSPALFIPIAEESGLILSIGQWVIETACQQLAAWRHKPHTAALTMSVNVSASQFRHDDFVDQVANAARRAGVGPGHLKLELTESLLVYDMEAIIEKMQLLKSHGLGLSLDDFGTGYSSLSYLKRMPLEQLKIDQSFVRDVMTDPNDAAIAKTVIELAQSLGLTVIAEGVEREDQRDFLFGNGCDAYQGYLLSRPLPVHELDKFLAQRAGEALPSAPMDLQPPSRRQSQVDTLLSITEAIPAMICVNGADERYRYVNRAFERWFGLSSAMIIGRTSLQVLGPAEYARSALWIAKALSGETVSFEKEFLNRHPTVHIAVSFIPLRLDSGQLDGYVTVAQDVTHHRNEAVRLLKLSERDMLTGLLNRRGFESYLQQAIEAGGAASLALLYVDIDHFKPINDRHGHPVGDVLLREFAQRLRNLVRPNDAVARLGGDEFAIVLSGVPSQEQCVVIADKVLAAAHAPFDVGDLRLQIGASVGIAFDADDAQGLSGLIKRADAMLYQAKAAGRGRWA